MFSTQDDSNSNDFVPLSAEEILDATSTPSLSTTAAKPRRHHDNRDIPNSPVKKRSRGLPMFKLFGQGTSQPSTAAADSEHHPNKQHPGLFGYSQDSMMSTSQLSQDFADRIGELSILSNQDYATMPSFANNTNSTDGFSIPFYINRNLLAVESTENSQLDGHNHHNAKEKVDSHKQSSSSADVARKEIILPLPFDNPFIPTISNGGIASHGGHRNHHRRISQPRTMWITAFGERPRLLSDYEVFEVLGEGSFSTVVKARRRLDGMYYAIKKIKKRITNDKEGSLFLREVCALAILQSSPNIVRFYGSWIDDGYLHIQTEICELGNLELWFVNQNITTKSHSDSITSTNSMICNSDDNMPTVTLTRSVSVSSCRTATSTPTHDIIVMHGASEEMAWYVLYHISETLSYLHSKDMVHLDLRPANIFLTHSDSMQAISFHTYHDLHDFTTYDIMGGLLNSNYALRLGDFGHSCRVDEAGFIINEGETRYCARELISTNQTRQIDLKKADMFSLGASVYELCIGRRLGSDGDGAAEWHSIRDGQLNDPMMTSFSASLCNMLKQLVSPVSSDRPSAVMVVQACLNKATEHMSSSSTSATQPLAHHPTEAPVSVYTSTPSAPIPSPSPSSNTLLVLLDEVERLKKQLKESRQEISKLKSNHR